jgi:hypothetical protein
MKNIVPMTLILLMFASVFANTAWIEMNENEIDGAADGRADDDVGILGILEPRATKIDTQTSEMRNTVKAGNEVNFIVAVKNYGTNAVTEMNIVASIFLEDGTTATDSSGNALTWTDAVICDDLNACQISSLAAGSYLSGGSYAVRNSLGADIAWTPELGSYTILISLEVPSGDENIQNDEFAVDITVVDWYDLAVDLEWDSGADQAEGAGPHAFTMTVSTDGSVSWEPRNVSIDLMITGAALDTAIDADGNNISGTTTIEAGNLETVEIFFNESAPCDPGNDTIMGTADDGPCDPRNGNASRSVIHYQDSWTFTGSVTPDSNADGAYQVEAALRSYVLFGGGFDCQETGEISVDSGPDGIEGNEDDTRETVTFFNMCEVEVYTDDNNSNNEDMITGFVGSFHNIALTSLSIAQGFDSMGGGEPTSLRGDGDEISVGFSRLFALVEHRGSPATGPYNWSVDFVVHDVFDNQTVATYSADECVYGEPSDYSHQELGAEMPAELLGIACQSHDFGSGSYKVTATVSMIDSANPDESSIDDSESVTVEARNNLPIIDLTLTTEGDIIVGDMISFEVSAFDAEDVDGTSLTYAWSRVTTESTSVEIPECSGFPDDPATPEDESTKGTSSCTVAVDNTWATTLPVTVKVTDPHGGEASDSESVKVWNRHRAEATAADGAVSISYDLTYLAISTFSITTSDSNPITGILLGNSEEGADSVYVIDYAPSTTYMAEDTGSHSLSITFPGSSTEDYSLWYQYPGQNWTLLDGAAEQDGSTNMTLEWNNNSSPVLSNGLLGIFNAAAGDGAVPANGVTNAIGVPMANGLIAVQWTLSGDGLVGLLDKDRVQVCSTTNEIETCTSVAKDATQHLLVGASHGQVFTGTVSVVNINGANPNVATFTATADAEVSPAPTTTFGAIENGSTAWTFTITTADSGDATKLHVCWKDSTYEASQLTPDDLSCQEMDIADGSVDITKPSVTSETVYHFSIFAEDGSGNVVALSDTTTQTRYGELDDPGAGEGTLDDDKSGTTDVPTWTWGVIIGIVVVAFGIGAFILSRGGEGGEGKEWDY